MPKIQCLILLLFTSISAFSQDSILGQWKSIDDKTGEAKSVVEIFERNGFIYGKVIKTFPKPGREPDPVCDKCPQDDDRYNKKIIGMEIIRQLKKQGNEYSGGDILDPEAGKIYRCKIWLDGKDLKVRGYWGPVWRTQTWKRVS
ncbi:MAG: DUF2147 domain-containing protein [Cyclobacteriaceae bacterium]|nr:DUF2147 domain-containing protein [Cyclobacteriaceae bacterium]